MPKTAVKFGQELQATLQPMIIKPSAGGVQVCFSSVVSVFYVNILFSSYRKLLHVCVLLCNI